MNNCYCGREQPYDSCCRVVHVNIQNAFTAEDLMRSRYSAFVIANGDYLQQSHYSKTRPSVREKKSIEEWTKQVHWVKLEVEETSKGTSNDIDGTVSFRAFYLENGELQVIKENSYFMKENGCWVYVGLVQ